MRRTPSPLSRRGFIAGSFFGALSACAHPVRTARGVPDEPIPPFEPFIDELTLLDSRAPGLHDMAMYGGFLAVAEESSFEVGVIGSPPAAATAPMRALVRHGVRSLPVLIEHLNDVRPTKLAVGSDFPPKRPGSFFFMFQYFSDEYDARHGSRMLCESACMDKPFSGEYVARVGDVCYVLVGQIVNRHLRAIRYQPTAGLVVNSPLEAPSLVERVRRDWTGLTMRDHEQSLLADLRGTGRSFRGDDALVRLRFYYPATYSALTGRDAVARDNFESEERRRSLRAVLKP